MMRFLVPLLFVMVAVYWLCELLWFVFVTHFVDVVASVLICFVALFFYWFASLFKRK